MAAWSRPRLGAACCAVVALTLLYGCGTTKAPRREGQTSTRPPNTTAPRGGAYYQNDGPGDHPPANLDQLPDAVPRVDPYVSGANRPYAVLGHEYVPDTSDRPFRQRGVGSWYGRQFHGQRTSSGEIYDMYGMTAAHPTLPIPCYVRVTNPANGHSVIVRVNDRGPFLNGRIIDLSYAAAYKLGYMSSGSAQIEVERLTPKEILAGHWGNSQNGRNTQLASAGANPAPAPSPVAVPMPRAASPAPLPLPVLTTPVSELPKPTAGLAAPVEDHSAAHTEHGAPLPDTDSRPPMTTPAPDVMAASTPDSAVAPPAIPPGNSPVPPTTNPPRTEAVANGYFLQLGAFRSQSAADEFSTKIGWQLEALAERLLVSMAGELYRVQLGPYADRSEAESAASQVRAALDFQPYIVTPR